MPLIPAVRDSAPVCDRSRDVGERIPRDFASLAKQVQVEEAALSVRVVEFVFDVPPQRAKLLSLLQNGVEKTQRKYYTRVRINYLQDLHSKFKYFHFLF